MLLFEIQQLPVVFVVFRLIISEPTRALSGMNSLLLTTKLRLLHFSR